MKTVLVNTTRSSEEVINKLKHKAYLKLMQMCLVTFLKNKTRNEIVKPLRRS